MRRRKADGNTGPAVPPPPTGRPELSLPCRSWNRGARLAIESGLKARDRPPEGASRRSISSDDDRSDRDEAVGLGTKHQPGRGAIGKFLQPAFGETKCALGEQHVRPQSEG